MSEKQTFKTHVRWHAPFHFVLAPILALNLIFAIVRLVQYPDVDRIAYLIISAALILLALLARVNALRVQDRLIRLEEALRYREILPKDLAERASAVSLGQIVALRFAGDSELPALVERTLNGEFENPTAIKRAVEDWQEDNLRV